MKAMLKILGSIVGATVASTGVAHGQAAPAPTGPAGPGLTAENSSVRNGGDTMDRDTSMLRDQAIQDQQRKAREGNKPRAVPALPADITVGREVSDIRGALIGTIESVDMTSAVIVTPVGKASVPLEAFGKNQKGLLLGVKKDDFDASVAAVNKPAPAAN